MTISRSVLCWQLEVEKGFSEIWLQEKLGDGWVGCRWLVSADKKDWQEQIKSDPFKMVATL